MKHNKAILFVSSAILSCSMIGSSIPTVHAEDWYDAHPAGTPNDSAPPGLDPANYPSGCYVDPVPTLSLHGKVVVSPRVRDGACMIGTVVKKTLPVGRVVEIIASTDGWYKIRDADGVEGWVGAQLMAVTDEPVSPLVVPPTPKPVAQPIATPKPVVTSNPFEESAATTPAMSEKRVQTISGVNMRAGASTRAKILRKMKARSVLQLLDKKAKGWSHVRDADGTIGYISSSYLRNTNLPLVTTAPTPAPSPTPVPSPNIPANPGVISMSPKQEGSTPSGIDLVELNRYWIGKINALRAEKGLRQLVLDQRWVDTASEYAAYMGINHVTAHERADGKTMHQWIDTKGLAFSKRYSADGWQTNYFTENISWNQISTTMEDAKRALDDTLKFYLDEAATNGPHYRTIYHKDWNSVGAGFYFEDIGNGQVKFYQVFHYGSLQM